MIDKAILLPTYNEEEGIKYVIESIYKHVPDATIFLADSSKDRTPEIAQSMGAIVFRTEKRGKAYSVRDAFRRIEAKRLIMIDADGTYPSEILPRIFEMLEEYDAVLTSRMRGKIENGAMPLINRFTNIFTSFYARTLLDSNVTDVMSGMIGMNRNVYKTINIVSDRFELEVEIIVELARNRFRTAELAIKFGKRYGVPKIEWIDGFRILFHLTKRSLPLLSKGIRGWRVDTYGLDIYYSRADRIEKTVQEES